MQSLVRPRPALLWQLGQGSKQTKDRVHDIEMERHSRTAEFYAGIGRSSSNWSQAMDSRVNEITNGELTAAGN
jgi:hypothetical protein